MIVCSRRDSSRRGFDDSGLTPLNDYIITNIPMESKADSYTNNINIDFQMRTWIVEESSWVTSFVGRKDGDHDYIREISRVMNAV